MIPPHRLRIRGGLSGGSRLIFRLAALSMAAWVVSGCAAWTRGLVAWRVEEEYRAIAGRGELWPGFDPLSIPLAAYHGRHTFLFRHPSPPEGFDRAAERDPVVWMYPGRHHSVVANSWRVVVEIIAGDERLWPQGFDPVEAPGLTAAFRNATVGREGKTLTIQLRP
ncbi:MAG: hypothetical protein KatS3mg081_2119 [Gemmatimonadales bacterium]|nr:MAG: hypothetical protein KatS3mg081_2119 [Gemmatimonadales bacterium]